MLAAGAALAVSTSAGAQAQADYPDHAIRFVGGFPPGGPADLSGRMLAQSLSEVLGQQVVVENKSGAAGNIASQLVAEARPDGYTLLIGTSIMSIVPSIYDKLPYDPLNSFIAVAHFTTVPMIIVAPENGAKSIEELVALLRKEPGKHSYGSPGNGSLIHMGSLLLAQRSGGEALHVPYRGSAPAMQDTLAGRHAFQIDTLGSSKGFIDGGRLRILAVCANEAHGRVARRADGEGEDRVPARGRHLVPDLRAGRHAAADRRQAQRHDQPGDQGARHRRQGQGAGHADGAVDAGVVEEIL